MSKLNDMMLHFGADKFLHFTGGACIMAITNSWILLAVAAVGKEVYDNLDYGLFSKADVYATMLGGIFAFGATKLWALVPFVIY